jgi:hypothetical protein
VIPRASSLTGAFAADAARWTPLAVNLASPWAAIEEASVTMTTADKVMPAILGRKA